jgi:galactokinase
LAVTRSQLSAEVRRLSASKTEIPALEYLFVNDIDSTNLFARSFILLLYRMYGGNVEAIEEQLRRVTAMCAQFVEHYGEGPVRMLRAPARINILGEHIDYVSYLPTASLPFGSREHDMIMLYRSSAADGVRGASTLNRYPPFSFHLIERPAAVSSGDPDAAWLAFLYENPVSESHWSNYVRAAAYFARNKWGAEIRQGFDFLVDSGIPAGGGASSSSALVVLASAAVREVNDLSYTPMELARDASKAEWFVGTRGGAMDHITISLARRDHAVLISYSDEYASQIPLPAPHFRWITFFSQPADKGREVMIEYNERAAVSRILLPAIIERWKTKEPERYTRWLAAIGHLSTGESSAHDEIEALLHELPIALSLTEFRQDYPEAFSACARSFPALVSERVDRPLPLRARALHHIGEVRRVNTAVQVLEKLSQTQIGSEVSPFSVLNVLAPNPVATAPGSDKQERGLEEAMRLFGSVSDQSHASLRDLYEVSTPDVEKLIAIIRTSPGVYGARLMGGGFGGNVLALTTDKNTELLIARVQSEYYGPQNRHGVTEGSVMISTPGDGLAEITVESVWREAIETFNSSGKDADR